MASLITHVVLADKVYDQYFKGRLRKDFMIGTCLPDIRFLGVIDRDRTHYSDTSVDDLSDDTDFIAGMKFHSIVDRIWLKHLHEMDLLSLCPRSEHITYAVKDYVDWMLYDRNEKWDEDIKNLDDTIDEEVEFVGLEHRNEVEEWHKVLQDYFAELPNGKSIRRFGVGLRASETVVEDVLANYRIIKSEEKITPLVLKFYDTFEDNI